MKRFLTSIAALAWMLHGSAQTPPPAGFDVLITGGTIVDGTGSPWYRADVGIAGDRIVRIGRLSDQAARTRIDATGLVVAPGFIDMLGQSEFNLLVDNRAASKLLQGVTTELTGEGSSIGPLNDRVHADDIPTYEHFGIVADWRTLGDYLKRLDERTHPAINLGSFVGAGGVRTYVMGKDDRPPNPAELAQMKQLVADAMEQGAFGLSSSLQYVPDRFATTDELVELATRGREVRRHLHHASAVRERPSVRVARRSVRDRRAREDSGGDLSSEDGLRAQLRQDARGAEPDSCSACAWAGHHGGSVSLHAGLERPRRLSAAVGSRRRHRQDDRQTERSGSARAHQARDERRHGDRVGEPVDWLRRRRRSHGRVGHQTGSAKI